MSLWDDVHIRQKIEVAIEVMKKPLNFGSTIVRKNDTAVYFPMPSAQQAAGAIKKGMPCDVSIIAEENFQILFKGEITDVQAGQPPMVQTNRPAEDKLRRRSGGGATIRVSLPITYRIMKDPVTPVSDMKKGDTVAIGTNDCTIHTTQQIKPGSYAEITLTLPKEQGPTTLVGLVEDSSEVKTGELVSYDSYIKYEVIRPGEQDRLVKFILEQQRILRKRGMV